MKKNKKRNRIMLLLILLLGISIGFAALATTVKINGNASITKNTWSVYWDEDSIAVTQGSKGDTIPDVVNGEDGSITVTGSATEGLSHVAGMETTTSPATNNGTIDLTLTTPSSGVKIISAFGMFTDSATLTNNGDLIVSATRYAGGMSNEDGAATGSLINKGTIQTTNTNSICDTNGARSIGIYTDGTALNQGTITAIGGSKTQITSGMISGANTDDTPTISGVSLVNENTINVLTEVHHFHPGVMTSY